MNTPIPITPKERAFLQSIVDSEYQDGDPTDNHIWLDYVTGSKSKGGVLASLMKKGLVNVHLVAKAVSDNRFNGISDSTIAITEAGMQALLPPAPTNPIQIVP